MQTQAPMQWKSETTFHQTGVAVNNPSGTAKLMVSIQGQTPRKAKRTYDWTNDRAITTIGPKSIGSIGGGVITDERRFVLIAADAPTTIEVTSRDGTYIVEELKPVQYKDCIAWDDKTDLESPKYSGSTYKLGPDRRVSFRINLKDSWGGNTEDCYLNFRNLGDANVRIVAQAEEECWQQEPPKWLPPALANDVAPGATREFLINDTSRVVIETDSERDITLVVTNTNVMHALRLSNGTVTVIVAKSEGANNTPNSGAGAGHSSGQITVRKDQPVVIQQLPL